MRETVFTVGKDHRGPVLVTGGAGFIGANLVRALLDQGHPVTILDNFSMGDSRYLEGLSVEVVVGDILDARLVTDLVARHQGIVHLAAQTGVPASLADPRMDLTVNAVGTLNLLEALRGCTTSPLDYPRRLVFASSNAPLGRQSPPASEDKAPLPMSPYGASKLAAEGYCLAYYSSWNVDTVVLRFANVYGPFSGHKGSVVSKFIRDAALNHGELVIDGDGSQTRDFIYVGDLCEAILLSLITPVAGEVFHIATGIETSIIQLSREIERLAERRLTYRSSPSRRGDIQRNYSSIAKARELLHWAPQVEIGRGLRVTWEWFRSQP